ncbi:uncharacterized protein LOC110679479 [Aedes aegypti]|uniref:Uncharacterized protein n=1 Tax=Aedes aegypti TaxID=7159 RepID=A0A6I8U0N1_AEDAE|nr:uncharacterized protein LOC110679479 [Aedes aegypti]
MKLIWFVLVVGLGASVVHSTDNESDHYSNSTRIINRRKRYLIFRNISRGFARVNVRDRMADSTNIWAQGAGFRWNIEYNNPPGLKITKRDIHKTLGEMIQIHDFDGRACILRTICELSHNITPNSGIIFKLFKRIFSPPLATDDTSNGSSSLPQGDEIYFPYLTSDDCAELDRHCPISQLEILDSDNAV